MEDDTSPKNENASAAELNNTDGPHNVSLYSHYLKLCYVTVCSLPSSPHMLHNEQYSDGLIASL